MATNAKRSEAAVNAAMTAMGALANSGVLRLFDGTQPATADTNYTGAEHILAELTMSAGAFGAASGGVIVAAAITPDTDANASGTATWYRLYKSGGSGNTDVVCDGNVGVAGAGCDLTMNAVGIVQHASVLVTGLTLTDLKNA